jgi:hypothetical protein
MPIRRLQPESRLAAIIDLAGQVADDPSLGAWLGHTRPPARATVKAKLVEARRRVEITAVAASP